MMIDALTAKDGEPNTELWEFLRVAHRPATRFDFPPDDLIGTRFIPIDHISQAKKSSRYLCVCKLDDIWQLQRKNYESRSEAQTFPYLPDLISSKIGDDLRDGRCYLLFDLSGEGHPFVRESFDDLHSWCQTMDVDLQNIGFVSQNRALASEYLRCYSEMESAIGFYVHDWILRAFAGMLASDDALFASQFRLSKSDSLEPDERSADLPFLCLNGTPRPLRVAVLAALSAEGLLSRSRWSLLARSSGKGVVQGTHLRAFLESIGRTEDLTPRADVLSQLGEKQLDAVNIENSNQLVWSMDRDTYRRSLLAIVTETEFTAGEILRVTEKSVKPLVMGRPAVIFGNPGSLKLLRQFGFQTFAPHLDESYDEIVNPRERFAALCAELKRVDLMIRLEQKAFVEASLEVCRFNLAHARNGGFLRDYLMNVEGHFLNALIERLRHDPIKRSRTNV